MPELREAAPVRAVQRPPADFAANLKAAQDWTPFDGNVKLVDLVCDPGPLLGRVVNIAGARPEWAAMKAVPNGIDVELQSGRATILLGAPPAYGTMNLTRRFSGNPKGNLVI